MHNLVVSNNPSVCSLLPLPSPCWSLFLFFWWAAMQLLIVWYPSALRWSRLTKMPFSVVNEALSCAGTAWLTASVVYVYNFQCTYLFPPGFLFFLSHLIQILHLLCFLGLVLFSFSLWHLFSSSICCQISCCLTLQFIFSFFLFFFPMSGLHFYFAK